MKSILMKIGGIKMIGSLIVMLIFLCGAFFSIFLMTKSYIAATIIGIIGFFFVILVISMLRAKAKDMNMDILSKAAFIYTLVGDEEIAKDIPVELKKEISRTMSEIAACTSGIDSARLWFRECMKHRKFLEEIKERNDD